ncbi:MAG: hypothetical protein R6V50_04505 [Thermoplasmatota archaeon]
MNYYCNECKDAITKEEFFFSMNRYKKPLCKLHQTCCMKLTGTTKDLQEFVKKRHTVQRQKESLELISIKDWINADIDTWEKAIKKNKMKRKNKFIHMRL